MKYVFFIAVVAISCKPVEYIHDVWNINVRDDMPFVKLEVNNKKGLFLLDTGAGLSLIDYSQAKIYGFEIGRESNTAAITGIGGQSQLVAISNIEVRYGSVPTRVKLYGSDMQHLNQALHRQHIHILGILGSDFLAANNARIDFENKTLVLNGGE